MTRMGIDDLINYVAVTAGCSRDAANRAVNAVIKETQNTPEVVPNARLIELALAGLKLKGAPLLLERSSPRAVIADRLSELLGAPLTEELPAELELELPPERLALLTPEEMEKREHALEVARHDWRTHLRWPSRAIVTGKAENGVDPHFWTTPEVCLRENTLEVWENWLLPAFTLPVEVAIHLELEKALRACEWGATRGAHAGGLLEQPTFFGVPIVEDSGRTLPLDRFEVLAEPVGRLEDTWQLRIIVPAFDERGRSAVTFADQLLASIVSRWKTSQQQSLASRHYVTHEIDRDWRHVESAMRGNRWRGTRSIVNAPARARTPEEEEQVRAGREEVRRRDQEQEARRIEAFDQMADGCTCSWDGGWNRVPLPRGHPSSCPLHDADERDLADRLDPRSVPPFR